MKTYQKILLAIETVVAILFILFGIPRIADYVKGMIGMDIRIFLYLLVILALYIIGQVQGGGKYKKVNKELRALDRELMESHRIDYYIVQNKRIYKEIDDKKYRASILFNIATAYYHDGKYEKSNNVIEKIDPENLIEEQQAALYNQLMLNYLYQRQLEKAREVLEQYKELLEKYENSREYKNHYMVTRLSLELAEAGKEEEKIRKVREQFDEISVPQKQYEHAYAYRLLEGKLMIAEGNRKEGKDRLRELSKAFLMPGMKREVTRAIKQ